jgi:hypothetical protein
MNTKELKAGSILSETSFFVVKKVNPTSIDVVDDLGNDLQIGKPYVEAVLQSADIFDKEEKKTMTELADLFINSPRIAMTVAFFKKDVAKTKKAYEAEKQAAIEKVQSASLANATALLADLIDNPISKVIPGDLRVMKGRHYGFVDDLGRIHFFDMELPKEIKKNKAGEDYDTRKREVDPRTIQYIIVGGTKFSLK